MCIRDRITASRRDVSRSGFLTNAAIGLELHHTVDHEVQATEPTHPHGEVIADAGDEMVKYGSPEHVGPVELRVALWIRQDLEDEGGRCFDPA